MLNKTSQLARELKLFPYKPDDALIDIRVLGALLSRSRATIYRDILAGRIPTPKKFGRSIRWAVGDVKKILQAV